MPGDEIDGYLVMEKIGEGNFGVVGRVSNQYQQEYAIKVLKLGLFPQQAQKAIISRFKLEFETGRIESSHLVKTHQYGTWQNLPYMIMDYCPNGNLRNYIQRRPPLTSAVAKAKEILIGLGDLHTNGKTHRDLKPENVLLDSNGSARLCDFGIAGHVNARFTSVNEEGVPSEIFGSYNYMAPEQMRPTSRMSTLLPSLDIFSFGVVCYELFTGRLPFGKWEMESDMVPYMARAQNGEWDDLQHLNPAIDEQWVHTIYGCLMPSYEQRYQSVSEVMASLAMECTPSSKVSTDAHFIASLMVLDGEEHGTVFQLNKYSDGILKIGRKYPGSENHIAIREDYTAFMSRQHATLELHGGKWHIRDGQWQSIDGVWQWVTSKNGTYVNGASVGVEGVRLKVGDIITMGNTTFKLISTDNKAI